jgi:hypothetical protein
MPDLAPQWYRDQAGQQTATWVTVSAGHTTRGISAALQPYGGIDGTVTSGGGKGVYGECVAAAPFRATADPFLGIAPPPHVAITRPSGRYRLVDLPPGKYKIEFSTGCGGTKYATQWWDNAASAKSARVITVGFATITRIDATLRP